MKPFGEKAFRNVLINIALKFEETRRRYGRAVEIIVEVEVKPMIM